MAGHELDPELTKEITEPVEVSDAVSVEPPATTTLDHQLIAAASLVLLSIREKRARMAAQLPPCTGFRPSPNFNTKRN